ncbi:MAG: 2-oxoacid:acceptor oxidoreductase family protein [Deltaproteobacteria bacterium]|nr:2-oxoacid:acceptor oxidoreductase family protein [Candidatus Anaeroferrophillus wilburensis]MBN2888343.1 2-oxoacid:acceptor oxidoreductase family protein [Deltaproteobacteria bacterium]
MILKILCAGSGGQGVLTLGNVLGNAAMFQGYHATYLPAYGAAMRGGTANCTVSIGDEEIASPVASAPDLVVAMNQPSTVAFISRLVSGGQLLYNSSIVDDVPFRGDIEMYPMPANDMAREMGNERSVNMIVLGGLVKLSTILSLDYVFESIEFLMGKKPALAKASCAAVAKGYDFIDTNRDD